MVGRYAMRLVIVCAGTVVSVGCGGGPRIAAPSIDADAAGKAAIAQYDKNGDGKISGDELKNAPSLLNAFAQIDKGSDVAITAEDIAARIKQWQGKKIRRMSLSCRFSRNKKPLAGATITFEPERFLGEGLPSGTGVTNEQGWAVISVPLSEKDEPSGVPPAFYLVRITKSGENIPAKYNANTTIGLEVSPGSEAMRHEPKFDLAY